MKTLNVLAIVNQFWVFFLLLWVLLVTMGAIIVNDRPLIVLNKGELSFPFLYSSTNKNWKDSSYDLELWPIFKIDENNSGLGNLLGVDKYGEDLFIKIIHGARTSFLVGIFSTMIAGVIGIVLGVIASNSSLNFQRIRELVILAKSGRNNNEKTISILDSLLTNISLLFDSFPKKILLLSLVGITLKGDAYELGNISIWWPIWFIGLISWTDIFRIIRINCMNELQKPYTEALRSLGIKEIRILFAHILPNSIGPVLPLLVLVCINAILLEASISFLGLGSFEVESFGKLLSFQSVEELLNAPTKSIYIPILFLSILIFSLHKLALRINKIYSPFS